MIQKKLICLDTETTGLNSKSDRIIEIGCVDITNGFSEKKTFQRYINPQTHIPSSATAIHGITNEMVKNSLNFAEQAQDFLKFIEGATLIIHNARFDIQFLNAELEKANFPKVNNEIIDSLKIAKEKFPGQKADLNTLMKKFKVNVERTYHGALLDAEILAQIYTAMVQNQSALELIQNESLKPKITVKQVLIQITKNEKNINDKFFKE